MPCTLLLPIIIPVDLALQLLILLLQALNQLLRHSDPPGQLVLQLLLDAQLSLLLFRPGLQPLVLQHHVARSDGLELQLLE